MSFMLFLLFLCAEFEVMNRLLLHPRSVFGAWYDDTHLLTQTVCQMNHLECISSVWLAKVSDSLKDSLLIHKNRDC